MNDLAQLRMLCRRGLKELDLILQAYLDNHYSTASVEEICAFKKLLQLEDQTLLLLVLKPAEEQSVISPSLHHQLQKIILEVKG